MEKFVGVQTLTKITVLIKFLMHKKRDIKLNSTTTN